MISSLKKKHTKEESPMSKSISFETQELKEEKTSAWLVGFIKFAEKIDVFNLFGAPG